ncbi:MAG: ral secretion pathway protein [Actinomycetota bacterium]|jgi:prepilin-type N-terminal cleavage/methylation domain-containing protein|nr:ral secretion pathway protein [Actinomycetota bacterium]
MRGHAHALNREPADGFTLIELLVVMSIASILMAIGIFGFVNWQRTAQQQGSASQLVSGLRNASERSVSEGRTYCLDIDAGTSYTLWRYSCVAPAGTQVEGQYKAQSATISFATTNTLPGGAACSAGHKCVYFYPRGTAVATTVTVNSTVRSKVYTVHVEGLTARVWM